MDINLKSGSVTIGGRTVVGRNIQINGNKIVVDGVVQDGDLAQEIVVTINGDVESLSLGSGRVQAGKVGKIKTTSGDVRCGDVAGNVSTMSGDVDCKQVAGDVSTMSGDISHE